MAEAKKRLEETESNLQNRKWNECLDKLYISLESILVSYALSTRLIRFDEINATEDLVEKCRMAAEHSETGIRILKIISEVGHLRSRNGITVIEEKSEILKVYESLVNETSHLIRNEKMVLTYFDISSKVQGHFIKFGI
jgi:hypothetical protein